MITNLRRMQRWMDINRYHAPIRIRQDWDVLHPHGVGLADAPRARQEAIADMKRRAAEHPRWDDHWPSSTAYADDADAVGSVDMTTNVAERQRRYDRRACQTRRKAGER